MNDYHDRTVDDPHPPAEDRPVAGWPSHDENRSTDGHTGEPLTGEIVDEEPRGERDADLGGGGRHERTEESHEAEAAAAGEHTGRDHTGEPFGTEEPMVITEPEGSEAAAAGPGTAENATAGNDAVTPVAVDEPVVEEARPTSADELTVDRFLEPEAAERFRDRWRDVKAVFVDDPADAVRQAGALSGEAVDELTAALGRLREKLDGAWDEGRETDTERLRVALRGYGSLIDRILTR